MFQPTNQYCCSGFFHVATPMIPFVGPLDSTGPSQISLRAVGETAQENPGLLQLTDLDDTSLILSRNPRSMMFKR